MALTFFKSLFNLTASETQPDYRAMYKQAAEDNKKLPLFIYTQAVIVVDPQDKEKVLLIEREVLDGKERFHPFACTAQQVKKMIEDTIESNESMLSHLRVLSGEEPASEEKKTFLQKAMSAKAARTFLQQRSDIEKTIVIFEQATGVKIEDSLSRHFRTIQRQEYAGINAMTPAELTKISATTRHELIMAYIDSHIEDSPAGKTPLANNTQEIARTAAMQNLASPASRN
jgi:hypothetical protein